VRVKGRISALLELGSGFNPEYSGRDNIFLSGQVVGMSRAEIESRYEAIVDFADIGDFIDQPVKTYSSGMVVRLAFATQTALDPDVLIVDEALAVGDMSFQIKCFSRMNQLRERGVTILFVTHSLGGMISFCDRGLYLRQGAQAALGPAADVARQYEQEILAEKMTPRITPVAAETQAQPAPDPPAQEARDLARVAMQFQPRFLEFTATGSREGSRAAAIESFVLLGADGAPRESVSPVEPLTGCFVVSFRADFTGEVHLSIQVLDRYGSPVCVIRDSYFEQAVHAAVGSTWQGTMSFALPLQAGVYYCRLAVMLFRSGEKYPGGQFNFDKAEIADLVEHGAHFTIHPMIRHPIPAPVLLEASLAFRRFEEDAS
jgi:homopolymeric O-antigen transport system ATP-binding protein